MELYNFFPTSVWVDELKLNKEKLLDSVNKFKLNNNSVDISNVGGYQGQDFRNEEFFEKVAELIPRLDSKPLKTYRIYSWVNVNNKNNYNKRHTHLDTRIFLSGVYYLKAPENCGNIRFYDPRGHLIQEMTDHKYFYNGFTYQYIIPKEGMILFFPSWLEHDVEENNSGEERISIAFNIFVE